MNQRAYLPITFFPAQQTCGIASPHVLPQATQASKMSADHLAHSMGDIFESVHALPLTHISKQWQEFK